MKLRQNAIAHAGFLGLFVVLFCVFGYLRTAPVWQRGLLEHDEGHALLNAHTWHQAMRWGLGGGLWGAGEPVSKLGAVLHEGGGTLYSAGKLGYTLLLAVVALPGHVSTTLALALAWLSGLAICLVAGALVVRITGSYWAAGIAVIGCMSSPLLMMLSTEASGTNWALLLGLVAAWLALAAVDRAGAGRRRAWVPGVLAGMALGYGFTCHFNLAPMVLAVFLMTVVQVWLRGEAGALPGGGAGQPSSPPPSVLSSSRWKMLSVTLAPMMISSAGVLLAFELATQGVRLALRNAFPDFLSFFGEHRRLFFRDQVPMLDGVLYGDGTIGWGREAWMFYLRTFAREGALWCAAIVAACGALAWPFARPWRVRLAPALVLLVVPLVFWLLYVYRVERVMGMVVAASWVVVGCVIGLVGESRWALLSPRAKALALVPFFVLCVGPGLRTRSELMERSAAGISQSVELALSDMRTRGGQITAGSFDTGFAPLWKWELVEQLRRRENGNVRDLVDFSRFSGADIIFVDPSAWRRPSGDEFPVTRDQVEAGRLIGNVRNIRPDWDLRVYDLRASGVRAVVVP